MNDDLLDYRELKDLLFGVLRMNDDIGEGSHHASMAGPALSADSYVDPTFEVNFKGLARLADGLRVLTTMNVAGDLNALAELMAHVANMVKHSRSDVRGPQESENPLTSKIYIEFSIACVVRFAQARDFDITNILYDKVHLALLIDDWVELKKIFKECLQIAMHQARSNGHMIPDVHHEGAMQYFEQQFPANVDRQISAESWWNLNSVAQQEGWSPEEVVELIDAHMDPLLDPMLVYRSSTDSASDWRDLYAWIHRPGGRILWTAGNVSSQR